MPYPHRDDIRNLRKALREDVATFGARFARSGRSVEDWEQGRRMPDPLAQRLISALADTVASELANDPA
jgi:DNA-binding transcriptional regulator YiaG